MIHSTPKEQLQSSTDVSSFLLKSFCKIERQLLKAFLITRIHQLFCESFHNEISRDLNHYSMECYTMDRKIIQLFIHKIVETGEYTLEGIARYTRIPFDVILDAACGNPVPLSVTPWVRIVELYIQIKPDFARLLFEKLLEVKDQNREALMLLLRE